MEAFCSQAFLPGVVSLSHPLCLLRGFEFKCLEEVPGHGARSVSWVLGDTVPGRQSWCVQRWQPGPSVDSSGEGNRQGVETGVGQWVGFSPSCEACERASERSWMSNGLHIN